MPQRAVVLNEGDLPVREAADPVPGEGHRLLRTRSCASCGGHIIGQQRDTW
jgi:hypothetical protein